MEIVYSWVDTWCICAMGMARKKVYWEQYFGMELLAETDGLWVVHEH